MKGSRKPAASPTRSQPGPARRDTRAKQPTPMAGLVPHVLALLEEIQHALLQRAREFRESHTTRVTSYDEFKAAMEGRPGFVIAAWCGAAGCEAQIKADTQATLRNMPLTSSIPDGGCVRCGSRATAEAWFAKAY